MFVFMRCKVHKVVFCHYRCSCITSMYDDDVTRIPSIAISAADGIAKDCTNAQFFTNGSRRLYRQLPTISLSAADTFRRKSCPNLKNRRTAFSLTLNFLREPHNLYIQFASAQDAVCDQTVALLPWRLFQPSACHNKGGVACC